MLWIQLLFHGVRTAKIGEAVRKPHGKRQKSNGAAESKYCTSNMHALNRVFFARLVVKMFISLLTNAEASEEKMRFESSKFKNHALNMV